MTIVWVHVSSYSQNYPSTSPPNESEAFVAVWHCSSNLSVLYSSSVLNGLLISGRQVIIGWAPIMCLLYVCHEKHHKDQLRNVKILQGWTIWLTANLVGTMAQMESRAGLRAVCHLKATICRCESWAESKSTQLGGCTKAEGQLMNRLPHQAPVECVPWKREPFSNLQWLTEATTDLAEEANSWRR